MAEEKRKKKSATWIALAKTEVEDAHGDTFDGWRIAAEGRSVQECQKAVEVGGAGVEHMFCRVELINGKRTTTPRQVLLWGAPRGRRPKVAATEDLGARMPSET